MKAPPTDFDETLLAELLHTHWHVRLADLAYLAVGFGDHHWRAHGTDGNCWFITVRDLRLDGRAASAHEAVQQLQQTFQAVRRLRQSAQMDFILAAIPGEKGSLVVQAKDVFAVSLYEWLDLQSDWRPDDLTAAELVARLHCASRQHPVAAIREDFLIPHRDALEQALNQLASPWAEGPFAEPARDQLTMYEDSVREALARYDAIAAEAKWSAADWSLTHGEPSGPNLVRDRAGRTYLVDWESARIAPPERDLMELSPDALAHYQALAAAPPPRPEVLDLYRRWYVLTETAVYTRQFRAPHTDDANMRESWQNFLTFLPGRPASNC